jgi:hypothetical protein
MAWSGIKRRVFISHYKGDRIEVDRFISYFANEFGIFIPYVLGANENDDFIDSSNLPHKFLKNLNQDNSNCYARYWSYPSTGEQFGEWIDDVFLDKTARNHLIVNPQEMMKYNSSCKIHNITL